MRKRVAFVVIAITALVSVLSLAATAADYGREPRVLDPRALPFEPVDGRGKLIFADGFEDSPSDGFAGSLGAWATSIDGDGGRVVRSGAHANSGLHSYLLEPPMTTGKRTQISKQLPVYLGNAKRVGLETSIKPTGNMQLGDELGVYLFVYNGTDRHYFAIRYNYSATPSIDYRNADGTWTPIWTGTLPDAPTLFYPVKIVADLERAEYLRAIVGGREYDLRGTPIYVGPAATPGGHANINIDAWAGSSVFSSGFFIDDVKVTVSEPSPPSGTLPPAPTASSGVSG